MTNYQKRCNVKIQNLECLELLIRTHSPALPTYVTDIGIEIAQTKYRRLKVQQFCKPTVNRS
jgi:hypothetical protein